MATFSDSYTETAVLDDSLSSHIRELWTDALIAQDDDFTGHDTFGTSYTETGVLDDRASGKQRSTIIETAVLDDRSGATYLNRCIEVAVLDDQANAVYIDSVTETAVLDDQAADGTLTDRVIETAVLDDSLGVRAATNSATDTLVIDDRLGIARIATKVTEAAVLDDRLVEGPLTFVDRALEAAVLDDSLTYGGSHVVDRIVEIAVLGDQASSTLAANSSFIETGVLDDVLVEDPAGDAWAVSTDLFNMTRYTHFPFNSLASVSGFFVAATDDGLYLVARGLDDVTTKINAAIVGDLTDNVDGSQGPAPDPRLRRPHTAWFSFNTNGCLRYIVSHTGKGKEQRFEYAIDPVAAIDTVSGRAKPGRGLRARYFRHGIENVDGADFELQDGRIHYDMLQRRA